MALKLTRRDEFRLAAESDLETFIRLVHPGRVIGDIHCELIDWWETEGHKSHQLVLLPREHQKSAMVAYRVAWYITKFPWLRVLYLSSTSNLAIKQLKFIKDILTCDRYRYYWPDMVHPDEAKREKWSETEISVDHPKRKEEFVREPTIFAAGLLTNVTGLHADIVVLDDIVVYENSCTEDGRSKTAMQYSLLASVESSGAQEWVVGTIYHPNDLYMEMQNIKIEYFNEDGSIQKEEYLFDVFQRPVESVGDGTGEFLWPMQYRSDGRVFGFNAEILARKKAQYRDPIQFRSQYYNDPNDPSVAGITRDSFQYYERELIVRTNGQWHISGRRLNIFAAVDFAFSLSKKSDYTAIVVVGIDADRNYYVLDIDRFKTNLVSDYYSHILNLHRKWDFRAIRAEVVAAQEVIVEDLKRNYIARDGLSLVVKNNRPNRYDGTKNERVLNLLQPRYANSQVYHYKGGNCQILEEELLLVNPPHDDVKDSLASCIELADTAPPGRGWSNTHSRPAQMYHSRFGGFG